MRHKGSIPRALGLAALLAGTAAVPGHAQPGPQNISLRFARTGVPIVLSALAAQVGFDLVVAPQVEGEVEVNLSDVDWRTALDAIVTANDLGYSWRDGVLIVLPAEAGGNSLLDHRVVNLRWADPVAVKSVLTNVLSARGKIEVLTPPAPAQAGADAGRVPAPVLVVSETPATMPALLALIDTLDTPRPQFEIQAKFVETGLDDNTQIGINWPTEIGAKVADPTASQSTAGGTSTTTTTTAPAAEYPIPDGKIWRFGTLSIDQLTGVLDMLSREGKSRLLSDPRVTVLENERAVMRVMTRIPVQTLSRFSEGTVIQDIVEFQDIDVGITLAVTPRLNAVNAVTLDVEPAVEEIIGYTGPTDNQRPITAKRSVRTAVRVRDGETLVIGGLVRETEFTTKSKVFLLGDIPLLGALFTHTKIERKKTDLLIFITPRVLPAFAER